MTTQAALRARFSRPPVGLFAVVMGIAGLSLAWRRASHQLAAPGSVADVLAVVAALLWLTLAVLYVAKAIRFSDVVRAEITDPVRMPFAAAITVALLLVATAFATPAPALATVIWWPAALAHLAITVAVLTSWFGGSHLTLPQVLPTWFIPIVGNLVTPLAGPQIGSRTLSWIAFGVGVAFYLALLPLILGRYILVPQPVPGHLRPVFAILIAPPAVALVAAHSLLPSSTGGWHSWVLLAGAATFAALLLGCAPRVAKAPYGPPWWALSFPLAALTTAVIVMVPHLGAGATALAWVLLTVTSSVVVALAVRSLQDLAAPAAAPAGSVLESIA